MAIRLKPIKDQVVVVAGAATGVGIAVARAAAGKRARVFLIGDDEAAIGEAARAINNAGGRADYAVVALTDAAAVAAARAIERFGRIDAWINDADPAATENGCRAAVPLLERGGGVIVSLVREGVGEGPVAAYVETLRREVAHRAPRLAVSLAVLPEHGDDDQGTVPAILAALTLPQATITVGDPTPRSTLLNRLAANRGAVAAVGLGGLALAVGALIVRRRGGRDA